MNKNIKILAIESSCDETSAAIISGVDFPIIKKNIIASQIDIHKLTNGVVPEVSSRMHTEQIIPIIKEALGGEIKDKIGSIDVIAVTYGPGLIGSLLVGLETAKTLALVNNKPIIPINHLEGHIYAALTQAKAISFPVIALIVSGGNTQLVLVKDHFDYEIIGQTLDDAVGEAFDKVAVLLGLSYPGGPELSRLAQEADWSRIRAFELKINSKLLPRPMLKSGDYNFSFSGLKTAVVRFVRDYPDFNKADLAASFQQAVVDVLLNKMKQAVADFNPNNILLTGGVAANTVIRNSFRAEFKDKLLVSAKDLCGDNAGMIGLAGWYHFKAGQLTTWDKVDVQPNLILK